MKKLILLTVVALVLLLGVETHVQALTYNMALPSPIERDSLKDEIAILNNAKQGDVVHINTDSPGGDVYEMHLMITAIQNTKATTNCYIYQFAASAAANISASCNALYMKPRAIILFHMPSRYYSLFGYDLFSDKITTDDWCPYYSSIAVDMANYMEGLGVRKFMTDKQWDDMLLGKDIILYTEDVVANFTRSN